MGDSRTVAVLYPGDMGRSVAALLRARGARVVTTLAGRSECSAARSRDAGVIVLENLEQVVRQADITISLVPPAAAAETAHAWCRSAQAATKDALYVDANSIGPEQKRELAAMVEETGHDFVDATINGLAKNLTTSGTLFLSGQRANEVAGLFGDAIRVRVLGSEVGRASTMKMLLGGVSKGLCGMFLELAVLAQRRQMREEFIAACSTIYPGIMQVVDRMLPTYAVHAARRVTEMKELESTYRDTDLEPVIFEATRVLHQLIEDAMSQAGRDESSKSLPDVSAFVRSIADGGLLPSMVAEV